MTIEEDLIEQAAAALRTATESMHRLPLMGDTIRNTQCSNLVSN